MFAHLSTAVVVSLLATGTDTECPTGSSGGDPSTTTADGTTGGPTDTESGTQTGTGTDAGSGTDPSTTTAASGPPGITTNGTEGTVTEPDGCSCRAPTHGGGAWGLLALLAFTRRRHTRG